MIKLIASDMDGTLINDKGEIDEKLFETIEILDKKNIKFVAASGRFYNQLIKNFEKVNNEIIVAAHNGAIVKYNKKDEVIFESFIDSKSYTSLIELSRKENMDMFFCAKNCAYTEKPSKNLTKVLNRHNINLSIVKNLDEIKTKILKITVFEYNGIKENTIKKLKSCIGEDLDIVVSGRQWVDVIKKGTSKGKALSLIQERYNIKPEETMVFGDHYNDLPMFEKAHHSYAMENAVDDLKKVAKFMAKSNNENGVLRVIQEKILDNEAY
ncbi:Cof-type HAD-IIB family hydrolase [Clostridium sediminicola]|uniref:HAD family hydrolase n=1 Tax=Clostridium sediminicola TaxID=3114879 RepID=UPI0031F23B10